MNDKMEHIALKYMNKMYGDLKEYRTNDIPDSIFFIKGKNIYMEYNLKNGYLMVDYNTIWSDLRDTFSLEYDDVQSIIPIWVGDTYKISGVTAFNFMFDLVDEWRRIII